MVYSCNAIASNALTPSVRLMKFVNSKPALIRMLEASRW